MHASLVVFQLIAGISILILGAECFVKGASGIAKHYHLPPLFIGIVLVGAGTSCPELVVSLFAAMKGSGAMAIGNAIGSNIVNMCLVLGVTALILPLQVRSRAVRFEIPLYLVSGIIIAFVFYKGYLTRVDGIFMLLTLVIYLSFSFIYAKKHSLDKKESNLRLQQKPKEKILFHVFMWCIGLVLVIISAEWIVSGAQAVARHFGISELVIGLTIVAIGTSLPELAATVVSAFHREHDIAVGNVIGANIFNLLGVLAMPAIFAPGVIPHIVFIRDYLSMLGLSVLLLILILLPPKLKVSRFKALILLLLFFAYMYVVFHTMAK